MSKQIDSGNTVFFTVDWVDQYGNPSLPATVYCTITSKRPDAVVRAETALTGVASTMNITVTALENTMIGNGKQETRHIKLRAVYGSGDEFNTTYEYSLRSTA